MKRTPSVRGDDALSVIRKGSNYYLNLVSFSFTND